MLEEAYWKKRFSVGLAMNTTVEDFRGCLGEFAPYIDNIYVSPPMGERFHGRTQIARQFEDPGTVELFWRLLEVIREYGISVEVVFNTHRLLERDVWECRKLFDGHGIEVQKAAVLDCMDGYYEAVKEYFPECAVVQSVNAMPDTPEGFLHFRHSYDEVVIGRQFLRDGRVPRLIHNELKAKSVLLLNNGCSFLCGGCRDMAYCRQCYQEALKSHDSEYLYALQSILPYELHDRYFDISEVDYLKLSTRNGDTDYIRKSLDSYISNSGEEYIAMGSRHYQLWARLAWHIPHYGEFDFERIRRRKREICDSSRLSGLL